MSGPGELTRREATGFVRGGMLFLEPPHRWRIFDRAIWRDCDRLASVIILPVLHHSTHSNRPRVETPERA